MLSQGPDEALGVHNLSFWRRVDDPQLSLILGQGNLFPPHSHTFTSAI